MCLCMLSFVCFSYSTCFPHFFRPVCLSARVLSSSCSVFRSYAIRLLSNRITFLSILVVVYFSHFFFSSSSRFSYTTMNANILEKTWYWDRKKKEKNNDECSSKKESPRRILSHSTSSLYICVQILFFSLFNKNFPYAGNHNKREWRWWWTT